MRVKVIIAALAIFSIIGASPGAGFAQENKTIKLPDPSMQGGMPLMQALKERKTSRSYSSKELPLQVISELLWAAYGINRPETGGRTVPTTMDMREIDIYVVMKSGTYLYDPKQNTLLTVTPQDLRELSGRQPFVKEAPVNLLFVADYDRTAKAGDQANFYAACDAGFISQNVYLYCASQGLATVVRGWVDREAMAKALGLRPKQAIILAQTVGYPKED